MPVKRAEIAVIGGTGVYDIDGLEDFGQIDVKTPFGATSHPIITGKMDGVSIAFIARHGLGHEHLPGEIPQLANIYALKSIGVKKIIAVNAVGSLKQEHKPGNFVLPDQLIDNTRNRTYTFFGKGIVAHATFAQPFCKCLSDTIYKTAKGMQINARKGGTLICIEGPRFSSKGEARTNRKMGYDIIGMTTSPEAVLAREAQMCYSTIALVTDYDCWKEGEEVSHGSVMAVIKKNTEKVKQLLKTAIPKIAGLKCVCGCNECMKNSIITRREMIPPKRLKELAPIIEGM